MAWSDGYVLYRLYDRRGSLLYIGQTSRAAVARWAEHLRDQPWAGEIARMEQSPEVYATRPVVLAAERAAIKQERPVYNSVHNLSNPHRVPVNQHASRYSMLVRTHRRRRRRMRRALFAGGLWLLLGVALWILAAGPVPVGEAAGLGFTVSTLVVGAALRSR